MRWINETVAEFGNSIGIRTMRLDDSGQLRLNAGDGSHIGILYVNTVSPAEVVLYRSISLDYLGSDQFRKALRLADFRHTRPWQIQAGCNSRQLILSIRYPERSFIVSALGTGLEILDELMRSIAS